MAGIQYRRNVGPFSFSTVVANHSSRCRCPIRRLLRLPRRRPLPFPHRPSRLIWWTGWNYRASKTTPPSWFDLCHVPTAGLPGVVFDRARRQSCVVWESRGPSRRSGCLFRLAGVERSVRLEWAWWECRLRHVSSDRVRAARSGRCRWRKRRMRLRPCRPERGLDVGWLRRRRLRGASPRTVAVGKLGGVV